MDHTIATIATVSPEGSDLGKPTLSVARDGHTTHARALVLSYDPPSAKIVLLVMRDYVRRHNRLPKMLVVDNGKEFHSTELELFCRLYDIDIRYRKAGEPRGGAMIERELGVIEEELFAQMQGNTRQMRDPRLVTKSINPFGRAIWTLTALWGATDEFLFKVKPERIHPALGMTPNSFEAKRLSETGQREHMLIRFDENIMLMTCPHARRPFHKVDKRRGVWVDGMYHWHHKMTAVKKDVKVEVRLEPWVANVIYVQLDGQWVAAIARNQRPYAGRTRRSVEVALREEQRRAKLLANKDTTSKKQLEKKERLWAPDTFDPRIDAQQREMIYLYEKLGMTEALPSDLCNQEHSTVDAH
jgi:transposase InsO family protein